LYGYNRDQVSHVKEKTVFENRMLRRIFGPKKDELKVA
jgi:hypothetical protein